MSNQRYDVIYSQFGVYIQPHFCREFSVDENGKLNGCFGMNPEHGYTFEAAKQQVIDSLLLEIEFWEKVTEKEYNE